VKKSLLIIVLLALGSACHGRLHSEVGGSGNRIQQKRDVGSFTSIATEGAFEIEVVCQKPQSLEIEGDDNILRVVTAEVSNNELRLRNTQNYSSSEPVKSVKMTPSPSPKTISWPSQNALL